MNETAIFTVNVIICSFIVAVHLDRRAMEREKVGDITKCFLIPSLYLTLFTASRAFPRNIARPWMLLLITLFYTLGDILLLEKKPFSRFVAGAVSFALGHLMYVLYFSYYGQNIFTLLGGMILFGIPFIYIVRYVLAKKSIKFGLGAILYAFILYLFGVGMCAVFSFRYIKTSILVFVGVCLFMFSDGKIALRALKGERKYTSFIIMVTYIAANVCLVLGVWCINVPVAS